MQANRNTVTTYVNTIPTFKLGNIWDRDFQKQIRQVGKDNGIFINIRKELKAIVGKSFDTLDVLIDLAKRYGNGFHHSNTEILHSIDNSISESKLYRDKKELIQLGILHIKNGVKNRSMYYLHPEWFKAFISGVFSKLGILQRQNDRSHIISNDQLDVIPSHNNHCLKTLDEYDNLQKAAESKPSKPTKPKSPAKLNTNLAQQIAAYTPTQRAIFDKLQDLGMFVPVIAMFMSKLSVGQIGEKIEEAKNRGVAPHKMGAYIRKSLECIDSDAKGLIYPATGGKIININQEGNNMAKEQTTPNASQTERTLSRIDFDRRCAQQPSSKEAFAAFKAARAKSGLKK